MLKVQWPAANEQSRTPSPKIFSPPEPTAGSANSVAGWANWAEHLSRAIQPALHTFTGGEASPEARLMLPASIEDRSPSPEAAAETLPPLSLASSETMREVPTVEARRRTVLLTWGLNSSGQLGFGDFSTRILPRAVDYFKATRMAGVVCGSRTTFVLDAEGKVFSFGKGEDGALGSGDRATAMTPRLIESLQRQPIAQIKCRGAHVLALTARGQLWAWGRDEDGQLGSTKTASGKPREHHHSIPERVSDLMGTRVLHVACGRCHSIAVDSNGRLFSWGGMVVVGVACGSRHTLALVRDVPMLEGGKERALDGGQSAHGGACVYSWGWGVYGQLGHGDVASRLEPRRVEALSEFPIRQLACGYRHSMVVSDDEPREVLAWGWGHDGQLGTGSLRDALLPQVVYGLPTTGRIELRLGGRHSLALCDDGKVFAWGKDDDGQLGLGVQSKAVPTRIDALRSSSVAFEVVDADCGWAHTALLVAFPEPQSAPSVDKGDAAATESGGEEHVFASLNRRPHSSDSSNHKYPRIFASGDLEGLFGQVLGSSNPFMLIQFMNPVLGSSIQFMLIERVLRATCGMTSETLHNQLLPGSTVMIVLGHLFFAVQGTLLSRRTRQPVTALPQGINIVTFFAWSTLIMAPVYRTALQRSVTAAVAARKAYDAGLCACLLLGLLELVGVLFVETLRSVIPRAAMLSAIAGVSLTFMAMGFAVQIFAAPATGIVSMLLMLLFYAGQVKLPFKIPGGVLAVTVGWALATLSGELGYNWFVPSGGGLRSFAPYFAMPTVQTAFLTTLCEPEFWQCLSVVIPMWTVTLVNNLSNIQSASFVGDEYSPRECLLGCALIDLACVFVGNPFPSCVYIGHPAFKAMGCRVGYLYLNILPTIFFGCLQGAVLLQQIVPIESGVGFILWVGLQITAGGFEGDHTPEGWKHGPAVALGLLPSIAAWSWQSIETTFTATRTLYCKAMPYPAGPSGERMCQMELHELMQPASTPMASADSDVGVFQRNLYNLYLSGVYALANGYLLTAIALSSMLVHIIDGNFDRASLWLMLLAIFASVGIIHSHKLDPFSANQLFPAMYLLGALILLLCHQLKNREEQIRELQVRWVSSLVELAERFPDALAPAQSTIDQLAS
ncbi:membrane protein, partial [Chrysochromulina tobinii]